MATDNRAPSETEQLIGELGRCVVAWSVADRALEALLIILLARRGLSADDAAIVAPNLNLRERAKISLALAHQTKISHKRLSSIEGDINRLQNDLRNRRNRLFHDSWSLSDGTISKRVSTGTRLVRSQARQIDLLVPKYEPLKACEVEDFIEDCINLADRLADQCQYLVDDLHRRASQEAPPKSEVQSPRRPKFWSRVLPRSG